MADAAAGGGGGGGGGGGDRGGVALGLDGDAGGVEYPNTDEETTFLYRFLTEFSASSSASSMSGGGGGFRKYQHMLQDILNRDSAVLQVMVDDVARFERTYQPQQEQQQGPGQGLAAMMGVLDGSVAEAMEGNAMRYVRLLEQVADKVLAEMRARGLATRRHLEMDIYDVLERSRRAPQQAQQRGGEEEEGGAGAGNEGADAGDAVKVPSALTRRFEVRIVPRAMGARKAQRLRDIRAQDIGRLVEICGMITRVSDVKPMVTVVTYTCDVCGYEIYQEVFSRQFAPLPECPSAGCRENRIKGRLFMQTRGSKFTKYQEVRIQELPDQVPVGHIPRTQVVQLHGALARSCAPGDIVSIAGVFLPVRFQGFRALKAGLQADTYLEAMRVVRHKKGYEEYQMDTTMTQQIRDVAARPDLFDLLARSLAPEIFGMDDVKKALLLQLVSGVTRNLSDGMRIRGDINILLMGDPGVAKSQLLKYIAKVAPRGVYTTGKGSSGVGLTAAVVKDAVTGELSLEGGALVLADKGICCIDEFDKMDDSDRTAIHEVMESQTISIAKAGIVTTLNARAAVLAAANPLYGRYNRKKSVSDNIDLPNSLLSRFDLLFLLLDKADMEADLSLARHVTRVHRHAHHHAASKNSAAAATGGTMTASFSDGATSTLSGEGRGSGTRSASGTNTGASAGVAGGATRGPFSTSSSGQTIVHAYFLKHYISVARQFEPYVPEALTGYIVEAYVSKRQKNAEETVGNYQSWKQASDQTVMTARQLLSILRLAQGLARLRFSEAVAQDDVDEALRLTDASTGSLIDEEQQVRTEDVVSAIYSVIKVHAQSTRSAEVDYATVEAMILKKGFTSAQLMHTLEEYASLDVMHLNEDSTRIMLTVL